MSSLLFNLAVVVLVSSCQNDTVRVGGVAFIAHPITMEGPDAAAGDLNNDGHADLVGGGEPLTIFLGNGTGTLKPTSTVDGGPRPTFIRLADIDSDGDLDILVANHETDYVTILLGEGSGKFKPAPQSPFRVGVDPHPHAVDAADFDGDDVLDLVVDDRNAHGLRIFEGLGGGRFETTSHLIDVGGDPYIGMAVEDLDSDGQPDIITPNRRRVAIVIGKDTGHLQFETPRFFEAESPFGVAVADFTGDGVLDILSVSGESASAIELLAGDGRGAFSPSFKWTPDGMRGAKMTVVGDFNGDGTADAAVAAYQTSFVFVVLGGSTSFQTGQLPAGSHPWGLAAADFNGDGFDDLVIADDGSDAALVYLSRP